MLPSLSSETAREPRLLPAGRQIRLAFLGCGGITERHARTLAAFQCDVRCAFASRTLGRARALNQRFHGAGAWGSYASALADEWVDVVLVATPPGSHLELVLRALAAGKDAIVEKPAFLRAAEVALVVEAEARSGRRVFVAENYRYKPLTRVLRQVVASGALGEVRFVHIDAVKRQRAPVWLSDLVGRRGALYEGGVHWVHLLGGIGLTVESVEGFRPGDPGDPERSALVVVGYEQGAVGTLLHSWEIPSPLRGLRLSHIYGSRGSVLFESNGLFVLVTGARPRLLFPGLRDLAGYRAMFRDFFDALRTGRTPLMSLAAARRDLELIEAALP